jgi:hypothetical protein
MMYGRNVDMRTRYRYVTGTYQCKNYENTSVCTSPVAYVRVVSREVSVNERIEDLDCVSSLPNLARMKTKIQSEATLGFSKVVERTEC